MKALVGPVVVVLAGLASSCVPAEDESPKQYGSVEFDLRVSKWQVTDFTDGWTFTVEHLLMGPYVTLFPRRGDGTNSGGGYCDNSADNGNGDTIVDLVTGAAFDINAITNGPCGDLSVSINGFFFSGDTPTVAPGVPSEDVLPFLQTADMYGGPGLLMLGTARNGALTKRVVLGLGRDAAAMSIDCAPLKGGQPVLIDVPNVRQYFHFDFDVEQFFPGSPPSFGPVASADTNPATGNDDGVVTWQELGNAGLDLTIAKQLNGAWGLRSEDGVCESFGDGGTADGP
jgi:hypothetical protein